MPSYQIGFQVLHSNYKSLIPPSTHWTFLVLTGFTMQSHAGAVSFTVIKWMSIVLVVSEGEFYMSISMFC